MSFNITQLHTPPATVTKKYPGAKYWCSPSGKDYFILATGGQDALGVIAYDFSKDRWMDWCDYPDDVTPDNSIATIDHENNLLYLSHGNEPLLAILNLVTKEWNVIVTENDDTYNPYKDLKMVKGIGRGRILPNGEFHVLVTTHKLHNQHLRYNPEFDKFEKVSQLGINNNCYLGAICLCYIIRNNYLLQFGGITNNKPTNKIWFADLSKTSTPIKRMIKQEIKEEDNDLDIIKQNEKLEKWKGDNFVWKEHKLKLPFAAKSIKIAYVIYYKVIVIFMRRESGKGQTFVLDTGSIFCL